jgi:hypothetical protein
MYYITRESTYWLYAHTAALSSYARYVIPRELDQNNTTLDKT